MQVGTKSLWARLSSGRRNCGRDYVISHGSGPTIFPAVDGLESLPDILQLCADGLHLFPVSACQVPETKLLSRNQPSPAKNISVSNSQMCLWQVDDEKNKKTKKILLLFIHLLASLFRNFVPKQVRKSALDDVTKSTETSPSGSNMAANSFQWSSRKLKISHSRSEVTGIWTDV